MSERPSNKQIGACAILCCVVVGLFLSIMGDAKISDVIGIAISMSDYHHFLTSRLIVLAIVCLIIAFVRLFTWKEPKQSPRNSENIHTKLALYESLKHAEEEPDSNDPEVMAGRRL